jgi:hypothetical protein
MSVDDWAAGLLRRRFGGSHFSRCRAGQRQEPPFRDYVGIVAVIPDSLKRHLTTTPCVVIL